MLPLSGLVTPYLPAFPRASIYSISVSEQALNTLADFSLADVSRWAVQSHTTQHGLRKLLADLLARRAKLYMTRIQASSIKRKIMKIRRRSGQSFHALWGQVQWSFLGVAN